MGLWSDINPGQPLSSDSADISVVTGRIDNLVDALDGTDYLTAIDINGGSIDGTPIGSGSASTVAATTLSASGATTLSSTLAVTGATTLSSTLGVTGNVAINTNKFNVTAASGNTAIAGTLGVTGDVAINTNKVTIAAASGNTAIAGTLAVTGTSTLTGNTSVGGTLLSTGVLTASAGIVAPFFGNTSTSYVKDTNYQVTQDSIVVISFKGGDGGAGEITGTLYSDATATPTTVVAKATTDDARYVNIAFPVKKSNYWKLSDVAYTDLIINVIPIGN
jgi:hypothetical protein